MIEEENKTIWCGNLAEQVTEELLYELFLQVGPLERVKIPKDRDGRNRSFAFITYNHEVSVPYALSLFRGTALYHRTLQLQVRGRMASLPPPIRCNGSETVDFDSQANVAQQFTEMTEKLREDNPNPAHLPSQRNDSTDKLVMASLQGNWSHRQHPYRAKEKAHTRDDFRHRDTAYNKSNPNSNSWRRRRDNRSRRKYD